MNRAAEQEARRFGLVIIGCLVAFFGLMAVAMQLYPGGTWLDRGAVGHRFFANFLCDLTQPVSLSGVDNRLGARFAQLAMLFFGLALAAFFWSLPGEFTKAARGSRWVRVIGVGAVLCFAAVPLTPSLQFGHLHAGLALLSFALGIGAAATAVASLARSHRRARGLALLGALTLAVGAIDALLFVSYLGSSTPAPLIVPAAQKVAALLLCAWMLGIAWSLLDRTTAT